MTDLSSEFRKLTSTELGNIVEYFFRLFELALRDGRDDSVMAYAKICVTVIDVLNSP